VQFLLADMAMKTEASRQLVYVAAAKADRGAPTSPSPSAAAKCFASDTAMQVAVDAVQLFGGAGLHDRLPGRALHARRQDHADLRGHQPDPAGRHGPVAAALSGDPMDLHVPTNPVRFVTAASLFDGHDAAINVMRRILQSQGAEVVHLGP
jgi:hypothetical protein